MRIKKKPSPKLGDRKTIRKFALLPIETDDCYFWLEFVNLEYVFSSCRYREDGKLIWVDKWIFDRVVIK